MADVKEAKRFVVLQGFAEGSCTIHINDISVKVKRLQGRVGLQSLAEVLDA